MLLPRSCKSRTTKTRMVKQSRLGSQGQHMLSRLLCWSVAPLIVVVVVVAAGVAATIQCRVEQMFS